MGNRVGKHTLKFEKRIEIAGFAAVTGKKEGEGRLKFDRSAPDGLFGEKTWEKAESAMQREALDRAIEKSGLPEQEVRTVCAGDLTGQCIASAFGIRGRSMEYLGLYGACSTMAEGLILAAMMVEAGFADTTAAVTSSHFCSAERQYRYPLEYGGQRTPTSQWTVTGSGAVILRKGGTDGEPVRTLHITRAAVGEITDYGIRDVNNMGAAMAPAAYRTIRGLLEDTKTAPADYDLIVTGDLGNVGGAIFTDMFGEDGVRLSNYDDCGKMIFDSARQDTHAGGSGCGCSASVLCGYLLNEMQRGKWKRIIFAATGALMSPVSAGQGESIPGVCHAVVIERGE